MSGHIVETHLAILPVSLDKSIVDVIGFKGAGTGAVQRILAPDAVDFVCCDILVDGRSEGMKEILRG